MTYPKRKTSLNLPQNLYERAFFFFKIGSIMRTFLKNQVIFLKLWYKLTDWSDLHTNGPLFLEKLVFVILYDLLSAVVHPYKNPQNLFGLACYWRLPIQLLIFPDFWAKNIKNYPPSKLFLFTSLYSYFTPGTSNKWCHTKIIL